MGRIITIDRWQNTDLFHGFFRFAHLVNVRDEKLTCAIEEIQIRNVQSSGNHVIRTSQAEDLLFSLDLF